MNHENAAWFRRGIQNGTPIALGYFAVSFTLGIAARNAGLTAWQGALASVIGGLADCPVIAVPTSVGYGASFQGLSALLSMLNSCASGVSVVNIDNGFGAGYLAGMINHMQQREQQGEKK